VARNTSGWTASNEKLFSNANYANRAFISVGDVSLLAVVMLFTGTIIGGSGYLIRELHRQVNVASSVVGLPPTEDPPITVTPDMVHVSSIALGRPRLAIINGEPITEGQSFEIKTADGVATLQVVNIADGIVSFKYGTDTISAKLAASTSPKELR
jgi:hypothetical protein